MPTVDLNSIANVLRKVAAYVDANESAKEAAVQEERMKVLSAFKEKYAATSGEEIPMDVLAKLADSGDDVVEALSKIASFEAPESLGGSSDSRDKTASYSREERVQAAEDRFLDFIMS